LLENEMKKPETVAVSGFLLVRVAILSPSRRYSSETIITSNGNPERLREPGKHLS